MSVNFSHIKQAQLGKLRTLGKMCGSSVDEMMMLLNLAQRCMALVTGNVSSAG